MIPLSPESLHFLKITGTFTGAGVSAGGAILAQTLEGNPGKWLLEYGFAGAFVLFLILCLRVLWTAKNDAEKAAQAREDVLTSRVAALEKETRDGLRGDLARAQESREKMIEVMERKVGS